MTSHGSQIAGHRPLVKWALHKNFLSQSITGQQPSSHRSLDLENVNTGEVSIHQSSVSRSPVTGHQNLYQPTISETHAMDMELTNNNNKLPLEPDFSNMSDPNVVIKCQTTNGDRTNIRQQMEIGQQTLQTSLSGRIPGGISLEVNINLRKGEDVDCSLHPPPLNLHLQTFAEKQKV